MVVKIRLRGSPKAKRERGKNGQIAAVIAFLLTPAAVTAGALALWRIGADMRWAGQFFVTSGLFSRWQIWIATGVILQLSSVLLSRLSGAASRPLPNSDPDIPKSGSQAF